jgi:NitT/TauT family transport system substrate-binding protein
MLAGIILAQALTLAVSGPTSSLEYLPLRVADAEGYFAKEGLTVTLRTTRAEPGGAEALTQGQAVLAATSLEAMLRFGPRTAKQAPRLVLGLTAAPPVALLVSDTQKDLVRSLADLPGTRVGLTAPGAPEQAWLVWLLARAGLSLAQLSLVSRGERGLVQAVETGEVHAALVREPSASRLLGTGQAQMLVDLRTAAAVQQALGVGTVNAGVFMRADRPLRDRDLAAFTRAVLAAEQRIATAAASALAERLPTSITVPPDEFEARLAACRALYLPDGVVTLEQVRQTLTLIRAHVPLPVTARVPKPEELLYTPSRRALTPPAAAR